MTPPTTAAGQTVESLLGLKPPLVTIQQPYQPVCACGWMGRPVYRRALAVDEAREHEATHPEATDGT